MALTFGNTGNLGGAIKAMCYAPAGFGKTRLCATAPAPLIISAENGLLSLKAFNLPYIEVETMQDFRDAFAFASQSADASSFQTVCIDSISDIAESALIAFKNDPKNKDPRQAYGMLNDEMMIEMRKWRHFNHMNVYITCKQEKLIDAASGFASFSPAMPGKQLPQQMPYWGDELFALRIKVNEEGKKERFLQTQADIQYFAKDRSGTLDEYEPADLSTIFNKIKGA